MKMPTRLSLDAYLSAVSKSDTKPPLRIPDIQSKIRPLPLVSKPTNK